MIAYPKFITLIFLTIIQSSLPLLIFCNSSSIFLLLSLFHRFPTYKFIIPYSSHIHSISSHPYKPLFLLHTPFMSNMSNIYTHFLYHILVTLLLSLSLTSTVSYALHYSYTLLHIFLTAFPNSSFLHIPTSTL